jgi:hypothetical protein
MRQLSLVMTVALSAGCATHRAKGSPSNDDGCALLRAIVLPVGPHGFSVKQLAETCGDQQSRVVVTLNVEDSAARFWRDAPRQCENLPLTFVSEEQTATGEKGVELLLTPIDDGFEFHAMARVFDFQSALQTDAGLSTVQTLKCGAVVGKVVRTHREYSVVWPVLEDW